MTNDLTVFGALVAGISALFLFVKVLVDTVVKTLKEDRDRWADLADRQAKVMEQMAATARVSVTAAEKAAGRDGVA